MAWESIFTVQGTIKATALVLFFSATTNNFEVKGQKGEV
jgi:hypothetical protein